MPFEKAAAIGGALRGFMGAHRQRKESERAETEAGSKKYEEFLMQTASRPDLTPEGQQIAYDALRTHFSTNYKDMKINPLDALGDSIGTLYAPGDEKAMEPDSIMSPGNITQPDRGMKYFRSPEDMARRQQEAKRQEILATKDAEFTARANALGSPLGQKLSESAKQQAIFGAVSGGQTLAKEPQAAAPEFKMTAGPDGKPIWTPESELAGKEVGFAPQRESGAPMDAEVQKLAAVIEASTGVPHDVAMQQAGQQIMAKNKADLSRTQASTGAANALASQRGQPKQQTPQQQLAALDGIKRKIAAAWEEKLKQIAPLGIGTGEGQITPEDEDAREHEFAKQVLRKYKIDIDKFKRRYNELMNATGGPGMGWGAPSAGTAGSAVQNATQPWQPMER